MRFKLIACKALYRELSLVTSHSRNFVDVTYIRQGYHDTPKILTEILQGEIDRIETGDDRYSYASHVDKRDFDAILLGYGLCSNGTVSLHSSKYKIVIPKVHDCISLLLGSREKYNEEFTACPGTYWYSPSWIENAHVPSEENAIEIKAEYAKQYGEENADFLYETGILNNYSRCAYINWKELPFPDYEKYTEAAAGYFGWEYSKVEGTSCLLKDMIEGKWDDRFLVVEPGQSIEPDYDGDDVIKAANINKEGK